MAISWGVRSTACSEQQHWRGFMDRAGVLSIAGERHGGASHSSTDPEYARKRKDYIAKQQRWLLFLRHCAKCQSADNACQYGQSCAIAKQLWRHILTCSDGNCTYSR